MNTKANNNKNQLKNDNTVKISRAEHRRMQKAREKKVKSGKIIEVITTTESLKTAEEILAELKASTWRDLETHGKFDKNAKLTFISDDMLIVGCDIGSEKHYIRAIDTRGRELNKGAFSFENNEKGFEESINWMLELASKHNKNQIVLGLEPTGHYWFVYASWLLNHEISVVQVNPYAVKTTKEIEDNSQLKDDRKDPKVIANLVKDGNYGVPYLPEAIYAKIRLLSSFRDQLVEDRIRSLCRMYQKLTMFFPEYKDAYGKTDGTFALTLLAVAPLPKDLLKLGEEGICKVWHEAKLRGRGYGRAKELIRYASSSVGLTEGVEEAGRTIQWWVKEILRLDEEIGKLDAELEQKCLEIPNAQKLLDIPGIGTTILSGILAQMGDISRFDDASEIQKLSGLGLVACSSGKHEGQTKISHRGRKRLRYWLFQAAKSAVSHSPEFKQIHAYYTTRTSNPQKKMQSIIIIACKLLRIIFTILKTGRTYDPKRMMKDIILPQDVVFQAA